MVVLATPARAATPSTVSRCTPPSASSCRVASRIFACCWSAFLLPMGRNATLRSVFRRKDATSRAGDTAALRRYAAARHVLTSPSIADRTRPHLRDGRIDWQGILDESTTMSNGERVLVEVATRLWEGEPTDPETLSRRLDAGNV